MTAKDIFTEGLYTTDQAARLAQVSTRLLNSWLEGTSTREPAVVRRIPPNDAKIVGFVDFIQVLAIRAIRRNKKISLQKIRVAVNTAHSLGIDYPFARKHKTFVFDDIIVIEVQDQLFGLTGNDRRQRIFRPIAEPYLDDLSYDQSGLASEYSPLSDGKCKIIINPQKKYGAPIVLPSYFTVASLVNAFESEGSIGDAAKAFEISETEVKLAVTYDNFLAGTAA